MREALAGYLYQSARCQLQCTAITISSGIEFLFQILIQILDQDSAFGIEDPGYENCICYLTNRARCVSLPIDEHGVQMDALNNAGVDVMHYTITSISIRLCYADKPQVSVLNWANELPGRYIVEDDYDSEFKYSGRPIPALQGIDHNGKVIYVGAFSKSLSPAHRISYTAAARAAESIQPTHAIYDMPVPVLDQKSSARLSMKDILNAT